MLQAIVWGLVQGITEFLPISSDGHLVLIPALLGLEPPDLATTAVLHLGTLVAVVTYFRWTCSACSASAPTRERGGSAVGGGGTLPAVAAWPWRSDRAAPGDRLGGRGAADRQRLHPPGGEPSPPGGPIWEEARPLDAFLVGLVQLVALLPGSPGRGPPSPLGKRGLTPVEAARFSFLLGIPTIAAAGLFGVVDLSTTRISSRVWVGMVVAAISGYFAIALLLRALQTVGLLPFAIYCFVFGTFALIVLL